MKWLDRIFRPRKNVPETLTAASGWCAPTETLFDLPGLYDAVSLATIDYTAVFTEGPCLQARRGGILYENTGEVLPLQPKPEPRPFEVTGQVWCAFASYSYEGDELIAVCTDRESAKAHAEDYHAVTQRQWRGDKTLMWEERGITDTWEEGWAGGDRYYVARQDITTIRNTDSEDSE